MTTVITKRSASLLDSLPPHAVVLGKPTASLLKRGMLTLKPVGDLDVERQTFLLVDNGKAHGVVTFSKRRIIKSTRGTKVDKGVEVRVIAKFDEPYATNVPVDGTGVYDNVSIELPTGADTTPPQPPVEAVDKAEPVEVAQEPEAEKQDAPPTEKAKKPSKQRTYTKAAVLAIAREARHKQDVAVDLAGEGGIHQHALDRPNQTTLEDGTHQHIFLLPDGETVVATALDGGHVHGLLSPSADVSEAGASAHTHTVESADGSEVQTLDGGEHMHSLQVSKSAVDGLHQHELQWDEGTVLLSLTPGQFWDLFGDDEVEKTTEDKSDDTSSVEQRLGLKLSKVWGALEGLTLSTPALTLLDTEDDKIVIQVNGPVSASMRRTIEDEIAKRLGSEVADQLMIVGEEFGMPNVAAVPLASHLIKFTDNPAVMPAVPSFPAGDSPVGKQRAALQYAFRTDECFDVALRLEHHDSTLSWVLDAGRPANLHTAIKSVADAQAAVAAADLDGSRYQRPLRGTAVKAKPLICAGHTLLDHEGKVFSEDHAGVTTTVDKAVVEYGLQCDGLREYFLSEGKILNGVFVAKSVIGADGKRAWTATIRADNMPTVLSKDAVDAGIMPPFGQSGLPVTLERETPLDLQYWRAATAKAAQQIRDALVKSQLFTESNVAVVDGVLRRVEPHTELHIESVLPAAATKSTPAPQPPAAEDPVRKVAAMLPDAGSDVVLFDRSLSTSMSASQVAEKASNLDGDDFLIAYPDTPGARLALSRCGRLFKLAGHSQTLFVTSGPFRVTKGIEWLHDPATLWESHASENVTKLLKRLGTKHQIPLYKSEDGEERFVYGIVLEPETVDAQDDIYSADEIRKACHLYMAEFGHIKLMHEGAFIESKVKILENFIAPVAFSVEGNPVKKGAWILAVRVLDDGLWDDVKSGDLTGFSIGGTAIKTPI